MAVAAKPGTGINKSKYITSPKEAFEQRQRQYKIFFERRSHRKSKEERGDFEAFAASSYCMQNDELKADELRLL